MRLAVNRDLNALDLHFNESSKHNSETTIEEAEYLIYKVGTIINLLEKYNLIQKND